MSKAFSVQQVVVSLFSNSLSAAETAEEAIYGTVGLLESALPTILLSRLQAPTNGKSRSNAGQKMHGTPLCLHSRTKLYAHFNASLPP